MADLAAEGILALEAVLRSIGPAAVAVSGGVDSMTLAIIAHRLDDSVVTVCHAVSPAVPVEATTRIHAYSAREGWRLRIIDSGEFADPDYMRNPANRCFFCKTNLYSTIARHVDATILSGTNVDDLADFRPGLRAAIDHSVRHPYVEAAIDKRTVRAIARNLKLFDLAELPAAPCLSSRIETGLPIRPDVLNQVDSVERFVRSRLRAKTVRCRVRQTGLVVELDEVSLSHLSEKARQELGTEVLRLLPTMGDTVSFASYRCGSAFLRNNADA